MAADQFPSDSPASSARTRVTLNCLKCNKPFPSDDKTRNRVCPRCNENNPGLSRVEQRGGHRSPIDIDTPGISDLL